MPFTFKLSKRLAHCRAAAFLLAAAALDACSAGESPTGPVDRRALSTPGSVASVSISPSSASGTIGQSAQFTATAYDSHGNVLSGQVFVWSSTDSTVVTVTTAGYATAIGVGPATLVARDGSANGTSQLTVTGAAVAAIAVSPTALSVAAGQQAQLAVALTDSTGTLLTGRRVLWTSSAPGVATVDSTGLATAAGAGAATITAYSEGKSATAALTVTSGIVTAPGGVTDLAVSGVTDSAATLAFTQVTDGTGLPASYDVRYALAPINWGSATTVSAGTCAAPLAGTAIGSRMTCTVKGLEPSTAYQFQLVAFRGTLNVNALFGSLSDVASASTTATASAVASVTVSPATAAVTVGATQQFVATAKDASGNVLSGQTASWTSSNLAVATVDVNGLVTTLLAGTANITATSGGVSGSASLSVSVLPPPSSTPWGNQPAGFTTITDQPWSALNTLGWTDIYNTNGYTTIAQDASAPLSPSSVIQFMYPVGFAGGAAPATEYIGLPSVTQLYIGMWWKPSKPWQGQISNVNKLAHLFTNSAGEIYIAMYGPPGGPYELRVLPQFVGLPSYWLTPNVTGAAVTLGQWHRVEWLLEYDRSNPSNGTVQWWMDGQLLGSYSGVQFPAAPLTEFHLSPTWGGTGDTKTETDYYWFDHVYLSHN